MNDTQITDFPCPCSYVHFTRIYFSSRSHTHWCVANAMLKSEEQLKMSQVTQAVYQRVLLKRCTENGRESGTEWNTENVI